jgi:hypothetical protein
VFVHGGYPFDYVFWGWSVVAMQPVIMLMGLQCAVKVLMLYRPAHAEISLFFLSF